MLASSSTHIDLENLKYEQHLDALKILADGWKDEEDDSGADGGLDLSYPSEQDFDLNLQMCKLENLDDSLGFEIKIKLKQSPVK